MMCMTTDLRAMSVAINPSEECGSLYIARYCTGGQTQAGGRT